MSARKALDSSLPLRERLLESAWEQGPITMAFFVMLVGIGYKMDGWIAKADEGYQRNAAQLQKVAEEHTKTVDKVISQWREDRQILLDVLRKDRDALKSSRLMQGLSNLSQSSIDSPSDSDVRREQGGAIECH